MALAAVKKYPSLREQVYAAIREAILSGRLVPGSLVSEQIIADQAGASRTPVREALLQLAQEGLVEFVRNAGVRITVPTAENLRNAYALRVCIETWCVRMLLALDALPEGLLMQLRASLEEQEQIVFAKDHTAWIRENTAFHRLIVDTANNPLMLEAWERLQVHIERPAIDFHRQHPEHMAQFLQEHIHIVSHIAHADPGTSELLESHLRSGALLLEGLIT